VALRFLAALHLFSSRNAPCTVRIARNRAVQNNSPVRILVGIDGSSGAEAAVRAVCERDWPPGSEARVVAALDPMMITAVEWIKDVIEMSACGWGAWQKLRQRSCAPQSLSFLP
jgi:hypothetical protein